MMKSRVITGILLMLLFVSMHVMLPPMKALEPREYELFSSWATKTPTIDGNVHEDEWVDAYKKRVYLYYGSESGSFIEYYLYVKNDGQFLYLAADGLDDHSEDYEEIGRLAFGFDVDYDKKPEPGRDTYYTFERHTLNPHHSIWYCDTPPPCDDPPWIVHCQINDPLEMASAFSSSPNLGVLHWMYELKIPLQGQESINTDIGQTVGMSFNKERGDAGWSLYVWPPHDVFPTWERAPLTLSASPPLLNDLTIVDISWNPNNPMIGDSVLFSYVIKNQGSEATDAFTTALYIDDERIDTSARTMLAAGETQTLSFPNSWTATEGSHDIKVIADDLFEIDENDETNNEMNKSLEINIASVFTIVSVDYPEQVFLGNTATVTVIGENGRDESSEAYLHVAFPFNPNFVNLVESDATNQEVFWPGDTLWGGYGEYQITAYYPVVMAWEAPWQGGLRRYLTVEVTPEEVGTFVFEVKMPARYSQGGWVSDPSTDGSESSVTDQQDEYVYQYQIEVVVPAVSDFKISVSTDSQTINRHEYATYTITVTSISGFSSPVELRMSTEPDTTEIVPFFDGVWNTGTVTPPSNGLAQSELKVIPSYSTPLDTYTLTITGTSEEKTGSDSTTLIVEPSPAALHALEAKRTLYENYAKMIDPWYWEHDYEEQTKRIVEDTLKNYYDPLRILTNYVKEILKRKGWLNYLAAIDLTEAIVKTHGWWQVGIVVSVMGFAYSDARLEYLYKYDTYPPESAPDEMLRIFSLVESGETGEAQKAIRTMLDYLEIVKKQTGSGPVPFPASEEDWRTLVATMFDDVIEFLSGEYNSIGVSIKVTLGSPADLHVYDPDGRHVGINYDTGETEVEIPYAYYTGPNAEIQDITIPDPVTGDYTIVLIGTSTGSYSLTTELILQNETVTQTHTGDIVEGDILESIATVSENGMATTSPLRPQPESFPWWILGAVIVVMMGVGITLILWKRRKPKVVRASK